MIPAGNVEGRDGRTWVNSDPDAIVAAFNVKLPFDIEHATELKGPEGEEADAAGWIHALENRNGEVWAHVEWNELGRSKIDSKRYLFYSPAFGRDDQGVITYLSSAGLTNKPNFYVPALNREEPQDMKLPVAICTALALAETATEQDAVTAINALKEDKQVALNRAENVDLSKYVPMDTHQTALNRAQTAEAKLQEAANQAIDELVDGAIEQGKVAPADKEMYVSLCRTENGVSQFEKFIAAAPAIVDTSAKTHTKDTSGDVSLESHEIEMCRNMGISKEDYLKAKKEMGA